MAKLFLAQAKGICIMLLFALPFPALALFDFGGWVTNAPGSGGIMSAMAASGWIYPPCINGVEEVNIQSPPSGIQAPNVLLQFTGAYTFSHGSARFPGQKILGKYMPVMVCIAIYLMPCGVSICPTPLPFFFAPLIIFNGSSMI